ncbi:hypothetical protein BGX21_006639, partial [Mortierella sp. AD011]
MAKQWIPVGDRQIHHALYAGVKSIEIAKRVRKAGSLDKAYMDAKKADHDNALWSHLRPEDPEFHTESAASEKPKEEVSGNKAVGESKPISS